MPGVRTVYIWRYGGAKNTAHTPYIYAYIWFWPTLHFFSHCVSNYAGVSVL